MGAGGERWPLPPPGAGALTTCKTLFNLNPLINISNHTSPSTEGENRKHTSAVGSLSHLRKERVCTEEGEIDEVVLKTAYYITVMAISVLPYY